MPSFQNVQAREVRLHPRTMRVIHRTLVELEEALDRTRGQWLGLDAVAAETNIHFPTDSLVLDDSARVLCPRTAADQRWFSDWHPAAHH